MYSIYHFFNHLVKNKSSFRKISLSKFPFDEEMIAFKRKGKFPDLAIRINSDKSLFTGGELVELKDSESYNIASFNSTIPTRTKEIAKIAGGKNSTVRKQMEKIGDDIDAVPMREVFYLIRGMNKSNQKVVLVHGSFFETIKPNSLISQSFEQVLKERLQEKGITIESDMKKLLVDIFSEQESFSKVRSVDKASVNLRFRIMTEANAEGNILNSEKYPDIKDNTINLVVPCHSDQDEKLAKKRFTTVCEVNQFTILKIKHHLNGYFLVFQQSIS
jgi:hypothetical protein